MVSVTLGTDPVRWHSYAGITIGLTEEGDLSGVAWHPGIIDESPQWRRHKRTG
ncbi:hypothetical protein ACIRPT_05850 [Streptomyces sp. NPDC101227]|uniref:hypothetical protein n=1 Tax=Streptomyces sp. NPDC101227 TaxID=3366136 RepID=UPI003800B10C